jgi:hypothetical protein
VAPGRVRRAGNGTLADGSLVIWTVAEGVRGRRWREVRTLDGSVVSSLLLETDPDGRFSHIELSTAAGLLTLHPEGDETLHGNVVTTGGVQHVAGLPWDGEGVVLLEESPLAAAAAAGRRGSAEAHGVLIRLDLSLEPFADGGAGEDLTRAAPLDADGLPRFGVGASWPLELD